MDTKHINRIFIRAMYSMVIVALALSVTSLGYATPVTASSKEPVGYRIRIRDEGMTFPENTPFYISHGFILSSNNNAVGIFDFKLDVDGTPRKEDFKDFWAENGDPDTLQRRWVFNFPEGMTGEHSFTGHWFAPCQYAVDWMEYPGPCPIPNAKIEAYSATLTISFTLPTFVAYKPGAIEGYDWPMDNTISIDINDGEYTAQALSEQLPDSPEGMTRVLFETWRDDFYIEAGDHIVMTDGLFTKEVVVTNLEVLHIDLHTRTVSGIFDPDHDLWVWLYGQNGFVPTIDGDTWAATFEELLPGTWGGAVQHDEDGDGTSIDFQVPQLNLRVMYGDDWVESFYEAGHTVSLRVTDNEGNVKATAEVFTTPRSEWDGAEGFQTRPEDWLPSQPDIQPGDWVYGEVDTGQTAQVQIGDISGTVDIFNDSISGTIAAPWFSDEVQVECHPWGSPEPVEMKYDAVFPNGGDEYSCSWQGEWDIQPGQNVGVGYSGPDGNWVASYFFETVVIHVNTTDDLVVNDGFCSLREAIIAANTNTPSGDMEGECPAGLDFAKDTIMLSNGANYSLTLNGSDEDDSYTGDLDIRDNSSPFDLIIQVEDDGTATISQDAETNDRVLDVAATVQIIGLTITGGGNVGVGGGIFNYGVLDLFTSAVIGNSAGWEGGGVFNAGTLTMVSSIVDGNSSDAFGGGIMNWGVLTIDSSSVTHNTDMYGGGGIKNEGMLTVQNSSFAANYSSGQGGALYNPGSAIIRNSTVGGFEPDEGNLAEGGGGGLFNVGTLTVENSTVAGNWAPYGGGLFNWSGGTLTLSKTTVSMNSADEGGGLHNKEGSTARIENGSVFSNNYAEWGGGGIDNWGDITITDSILRENNSPGVGDAISTGVDAESSASINGSCIIGNGDIAVFTNLQIAIDARYNWWGSAAGPVHWSNPEGTGDSVSDYIVFSEWLMEPPIICVP